MRSLNQIMDSGSEVMPPLLRHNKGFGWWLSHRGGCRGCGEASSQNLMHLKPSYAHSSHPHHDEDFEGLWNEIRTWLTSYKLDFDSTGVNEHFSWTSPRWSHLTALSNHISATALTSVLPSERSAGQASAHFDTFPHHWAEGLNYAVSVS